MRRCAMVLVGVVVCMAAGLGGASTARAGDDLPLGHADFYPSASRPVGYRGDGNGFFPGAKVVTEFWEGTPVEKTGRYIDKRGDEREETYLGMADEKSKNLVWKTRMPSWANTQPIVVGDKVFTLGEPDWLICTDARTGKVLWAKSNNIWRTIVKDEAVAERVYEIFQIYLAVDAFTDGQFTDRKPRYSAEEYRPMREVFGNRCLPRILAALKELDPQTDYGPASEEMLKQIDLFLADEENYGKVKGALKGRGSFREQLKRRIEDMSGEKIGLDLPWGNMVGWCMSVPVSDGEHVWASFGQGHTVCYDLAGNLVWQKFVQAPGGRTDSIQSPLLSGEVLVDVHGGAEVLRGLNKRTGEVLWEAPTKGASLPKNKGGYYVGSHKVVRLTDGEGQPLDVVVTTMCNIIRASDGKVVGELPWPWGYGPSGGPSVFNCGNIVYRAANGDGGGSPFTAYRLTVKSRDEVAAEKIWHLGERKLSPGYHGQVATGSHLFMTHHEANVVDALSGKVMVTSRKSHELGDLSNIVAGDVMLWANQGHRDPLMSSWGSRRFDGRTALRFHAADVSDPQNPKRLDTRSILGGENIPAFPPLEKYVKELYEARALWGSWNGLPAHFMHTDTGIYPQGNRLFVRSVSHLYCIGDPGAAWHTPKNAPAAARTQ